MLLHMSTTGTTTSLLLLPWWFSMGRRMSNCESSHTARWSSSPVVRLLPLVVEQPTDSKSALENPCMFHMSSAQQEPVAKASAQEGGGGGAEGVLMLETAAWFPFSQDSYDKPNSCSRLLRTLRAAFSSSLTALLSDEPTCSSSSATKHSSNSLRTAVLPVGPSSSTPQPPVTADTHSLLQVLLPPLGFTATSRTDPASGGGGWSRICHLLAGGEAPSSSTSPPSWVGATSSLIRFSPLFSTTASAITTTITEKKCDTQNHNPHTQELQIPKNNNQKMTTRSSKNKSNPQNSLQRYAHRKHTTKSQGSFSFLWQDNKALQRWWGVE